MKVEIKLFIGLCMMLFYPSILLSIKLGLLYAILNFIILWVISIILWTYVLKNVKMAFFITLFSSGLWFIGLLPSWGDYILNVRGIIGILLIHYPLIAMFIGVGGYAKILFKEVENHD